MSRQSPPRIDPVEKLVLFYMKKNALEKQRYDLEEQKQRWNDTNRILNSSWSDLHHPECKEIIEDAISKQYSVEDIVRIFKEQKETQKCTAVIPAISIKLKGSGSKRRNRRKNRKSRKNKMTSGSNLNVKG